MAFREEYARGAEASEAAEERAPERDRADVARNAPGVAPEPAAVGTAPAPKRGRGIGQKLLAATVLAGALGFGGYEGYHWWMDGRFVVSTDDAYVQADITTISAKVSGYVAEVPVASNQKVKAGDLIAKIDDGDYRLALRSARDKLATQQSAIARIGRQIEAARASVAQAAAQVEAAQAEAARAASDYARQVELSRSDYATRAKLDQAKAERDRTEAVVTGAQAALAAAGANVDVLAAQQVEAERVAKEQETAVAKAERDLSFTEIRAPVDGVIGNKSVEIGTFLQPGTRLAALVPLSTAHIDANFKETQLASLQPGQHVKISVDAYPDHDIEGTIESVSPASGSVFSLLPAENATGNFTKIVQRVPVRISVPDEVAQQGLLRPGLSVVVSVDARDRGHQATRTAQR
jgi:membrane fusion protein (multidrug efflux system)